MKPRFEQSNKSVEQKWATKPSWDVLYPAVTAINEAVKSGVTNVQRILEIATSAAEQGANNTVNMVARIGRASYLGERSHGTIDPGVMFIYIFLKAMAQTSHV